MKKHKRLPKGAEEARARAAAMARETVGRKTHWISKKREASRRACRRWKMDQDDS